MKDRFKFFDRLNELPLLPRILVFSVAGLLVLVLVWSASASSSTPPPAQSHATPTAVNFLPAGLTVSSLLFGTNLHLLSSQDQALTSQQTQTLLTQIHIQIIRMPVRSNLPEATEIRAAQIIKSLNAVPVVDLEGSLTPDALADDTRIVRDMNQVFGKSAVYYEYGNEEDLLGVSAQSYAASWNAVIPSLKKLAPQGQFIGPVTYRYDQSYLATFLQTALPHPDLVSWHEYTCVASDSPATCLAHIQDWGGHITNARKAMSSALGKMLPIMISEWNYAPDTASTTNATGSDNKSNNKAFVNAWTIKAFQTLAENHVFASMQYACTGLTPLVDSLDKLTTQGLVFQNIYNTAIAGGQPTMTPTPTDQAIATETPTTTSPNPSTTPGVPPTSLPPDSSPNASSTSTPTSAPTATPTATPKPTPTPTPHGCLIHYWTSTLSPTYAAGGHALYVSSYCSGAVYLALTAAPASGGHEVDLQICYGLRTTNCSIWVKYTGVNVRYKVASGLKAGQIFYINSRCTKCTGSSFSISGAAQY